MKHILTFIAVTVVSVLCLAACNKPAKFDVTLDKQIVNISAEKTDVITYTATGYNGYVTAVLDAFADDINTVNIFDEKTGIGTITFSTETEFEEDYDVDLTIKDASSYKDFRLDIRVAMTKTL
ncbi:MAG: hypothetical protein MJY50_03635 [Bacteroidales bacterium]|nr:hypothetical protein [Bacteroidales bacterium]